MQDTYMPVKDRKLIEQNKDAFAIMREHATVIIFLQRHLQTKKHGDRNRSEWLVHEPEITFFPPSPALRVLCGLVLH